MRNIIGTQNQARLAKAFYLFIALPRYKDVRWSALIRAGKSAPSLSTPIQGHCPTAKVPYAPPTMPWGATDDSEAIRFVLANRVQYDLPELIRDALSNFRNHEAKVVENRITWWYYYYYGEEVNQTDIDRDLYDLRIVEA